MYCQSATLVKPQFTRSELSPLKCRSWHCVHCAPDRKKDLVAKCVRGTPHTFLTLTVNPKWGDNVHDRARKLKWAFTNLRRRIEAKFGHKRLPFIAVFERQESGEPHLHIMGRWPFIAQKWLSEQMADMIGAPIVDIRFIKDPTRVAFYVAKYVGKDPHKFGGCKRYWSSQDYEPASARYEPCVFDANHKPQVVDRYMWFWIEDLISEGYRVSMHGDRVYIDTGPPLEGRSCP